jgi:hypothetical protein
MTFFFSSYVPSGESTRVVRESIQEETNFFFCGSYPMKP